MTLRQCSFVLMQRKSCCLIFSEKLQRRYRYKPKWATNLKFSNCQRALDHFDAFYKPVYGELWPSIRLCLLSLPKHSAVVNNFSDVSKICHRLEKLGCFNVLKHIRDQNRVIQHCALDIPNSDNEITMINLDDLKTENESDHNTVSVDSPLHYNSNEMSDQSRVPFILDGDNIEPYDEDLYKDNLNVFVPPEPMVTEKDKELEEELKANTFQPLDIDVSTVAMETVMLPPELDAFIFPSGDVSKFPQPKALKQVSGYYLMDAASIMPVLALNLNPWDHVLDLCAAPGGKSFLMLQTLDLASGGSLHCNDSSQSRVTRLKNVFRSYIPPTIAKEVNITVRDGLMFDKPLYNKVLVDVPCNTDRHVVTMEDNNLFKVSRSHERLRLMRQQRDLLVSAIKSCFVGGSVVYSTCTLAAAQNDGVIQAAIETLRENSQIDVEVHDLSPLAEAFKDTFTFFGRCRHGQLILPSLSNNFGPLYFAKLKRTK